MFKISQNFFSPEVLPNSYNVFRRDRDDSHGGVLIAVRNDITCTPLLTSKNSELLSVKLQANRSKSIILSVFYRPPNLTSEESAQDVVEELSTLRLAHQKSDFWIGGDFNLPDVNWSSLTTTSHQYPLKMSSAYINITSQCGVEQIVGQPTRGHNILDLFFTNNPSLVDRCKTIPGVGDHDAVLIDTLIKPRRAKPSKRTIYLWDKTDIPSLKAATSAFVSTFITESYQSVDSCWNSFRDGITNITDQHIPHKSTRSRPTNPWINTTTRRLTRRKHRAFKKARATGNARDIRRYKHLKATCQRTIRQDHDSYVHDIISPEAKQNPKKFWSFVKGKKQEASGVSPLRNHEGIIHSDPATKADILNHQFESVFTKEDLSNIPSKGCSPFDDMPSITVTSPGVEKLLHNLSPHKATGPDSISARLLKELSTELAPALTFIFQMSLDAGCVPSDWKLAHIVPLFKKGDKSAAANYRPVSLTAICSKIMEHILHSCIMSHLEQHSILTDAQHGFRSRRSCETQLIATVQDLARNMSDGKQTDVILLDFAKAFDKVPHRRLLNKLHYYGIRGSTLSWIENFLSGRKQRVLVEGATSLEAEVTSGVPQGTVMGPLLFLVFINDLPDSVSSNVKLFADDCLLYRTINSIHDSIALQQDLTSLEQWEHSWQMAFHPQKCTTIRITRKRKPTCFNYHLHGHTLETVPGGKYLGVYISQDLSWRDHIDQTTAKATRSVGFLRRNLRSCPTHAKAQAYSTLVRPVLEYASTVWDPHSQALTRQIEHVQRQAARFATGNYYSRDPGCVTSMLKHLEWEPLEHRRARNRAIMFYKIINNIVEVPIHHLLIYTSSRTRGSTANNIRQISTRVDAYKYSFLPATIIAWNNIPPAIRSSPSLESFRAAITTYGVPGLLHTNWEASPDFNILPFLTVNSARRSF